MGRILEALRQAEARRRPTEAIAIPRTYEPGEQAVAETETGEEMPFVEVGGPRSATVPLLVVPPARPPVPDPAPAAEPEPLPVAFQPVAVETATLPPVAQRFAAELVAFHQPQHTVSVQYCDVLATLAGALPADRPQVLLYTAAKSGVGTTNVLLNLAITRARQGSARVVVVDTNLHRPALAERLGLPAAPGLQDVLEGHSSLSHALQETGLENLHALTAGEFTADGPVRLVGEAMRSVLRLLRQRFDWILLDGPCWDGRPEVVALGAACDAVYLVLPQADAPAAETATLLKIIPEQGSQLRGCVLVQC